MDKRFENKMIMLKTVLKLLQQNESIWNSSPPLVAAIAELKALIEQIEEIQQVTGEDNSGLSTSKNQKKEALIKRAFEVASNLFAMATRTKDTVLQAKVNFPISDLENMRDSELASKSKSLAELARSYQPQIWEYGSTDDKLLQFEKLGEEYKNSLPARRISVSELKAANIKLKELLKQATDLLNYQIDRMLVQFESTNADFSTSYQNSRKVIAYGTRHEKPVTTDTPD